MDDTLNADNQALFDRYPAEQRDSLVAAMTAWYETGGSPKAIVDAVATALNIDEDDDSQPWMRGFKPQIWMHLTSIRTGPKIPRHALAYFARYAALAGEG